MFRPHSTTFAQDVQSCLALDRRPSKRLAGSLTLKERSKMFFSRELTTRIGVLRTQLTHCRNGTVVGDPPGPRFYQPLCDNPISSVGSLCSDGRPHCNNRILLLLHKTQITSLHLIRLHHPQGGHLKDAVGDGIEHERSTHCLPPAGLFLASEDPS